MTEQGEAISILVADDDPDDRMLMKDALEESRPLHCLRFVEDGEELMDYLRQRGQYARPGSAPRPGLILLDLNMPKKNGQEVLGELNADPCLRRIPVVVMTTSRSEEDIEHSYELGANSYITKPVSFSTLVELTKTLTQYWFETVALPVSSNGA